MSDIDDILRKDAMATIDDGGFGARVLRALPARAAAPHPWLRPALVLGSAAVGSALAAMLAPAGLLAGFSELVQLRGWSPAALAALAIPGVLLVSAMVVATDLD